MHIHITKKQGIRGALAVAALIGLWLWWGWADKFASSTITAAHRSFFIGAPVTIIALLTAGAALALVLPGRKVQNLREPYSYSTQHLRDEEAYTSAVANHERKLTQLTRLKKVYRVVGFVLIAAAVVSTGLTIKFWWTHSYKVDRQYVSAIEIVNTPTPEFEQRVAQPIAKASASNNLREVTGDLQTTRYIGEEGTWNALVERRTRFFEGSYEVVQEQHLALAGTNPEPTFCSFDTDEADRRLGGWFGHSLERAIYHEARGATFDEGDVYGLCLDEDHPVVVIPLKKVEGWWYAHEVPAGVALYDGLTGEVEIRTEIKSGELDGPVYPMSLAKRTREAATSLGSWTERKRTGFDETSDTTNPSEFVLDDINGGADYVTPLTPRGSSQSITAQGIVAADQVVAGKLNTLTVHKLAETRISNATMAKTVRADYSSLEWAAGLKLYEITPVNDEEWVASLGMEQKIKYRVRIRSNGESCLEDAAGAQLRCSTDTGENTDPDTGSGDDTGSPVDVPSTDTQMRDLTDAELVELQTEVTREVLRRARAGELDTGTTTDAR